MSLSRNFRILLADDDPDDRELFSEAAGENTEVNTVPNGVQLMKTLAHAEILPDFILIDLNMPEKSGKECLQEIRNNERFKHLPVIIYSTSSSKKDIDDTFAMGANLYITKPNSFSELKATIKNILNFNWEKLQPQTSREAFVYSQ